MADLGEALPDPALHLIGRLLELFGRAVAGQVHPRRHQHLVGPRDASSSSSRTPSTPAPEAISSAIPAWSSGSTRLADEVLHVLPSEPVGDQHEHSRRSPATRRRPTHGCPSTRPAARPPAASSSPTRATPSSHTTARSAGSASAERCRSVACRGRGLRAKLSHSAERRDAFEEEGAPSTTSDQVGEPAGCGPMSAVNALIGAKSRAEDEDADRREQRPEVARHAVAEGVLRIRGSLAAVQRGQQEPLVHGVADGVRGLGQHGAEPDASPATSLATAIARRRAPATSTVRADSSPPVLTSSSSGHSPAHARSAASARSKYSSSSAVVSSRSATALAETLSSWQRWSCGLSGSSCREPAKISSATPTSSITTSGPRARSVPA